MLNAYRRDSNQGSTGTLQIALGYGNLYEHKTNHEKTFNAYCISVLAYHVNRKTNLYRGHKDLLPLRYFFFTMITLFSHIQFGAVHTCTLLIIHLPNTPRLLCNLMSVQHWCDILGHCTYIKCVGILVVFEILINGDILSLHTLHSAIINIHRLKLSVFK